MRPRVVVLGTAQDGGFPHAGCTCAQCAAARADSSLRRRVASIGILGAHGQSLIVDATPDFSDQVAALSEASGRGGASVDAVLLTHAHVGHYLGLALLGREALSADRVPVYGTRSMQAFLAANRPWSHLIERREIEPAIVVPGESLDFDGVSVRAFLVPHRAEDTDTIGLEVVTGEGKLVYVSDTDVFDEGLVARICDADVALIDGTFYSRDELPYREMLEVRHPPIEETRPLLTGARGEVWFTHLNHTNRLLHPANAPILPPGFGVAADGQVFEL